MAPNQRWNLFAWVFGIHLGLLLCVKKRYFYLRPLRLDIVHERVKKTKVHGCHFYSGFCEVLTITLWLSFALKKVHRCWNVTHVLQGCEWSTQYFQLTGCWDKNIWVLGSVLSVFGTFPLLPGGFAGPYVIFHIIPTHRLTSRYIKLWLLSDKDEVISL